MIRLSGLLVLTLACLIGAAATASAQGTNSITINNNANSTYLQDDTTPLGTAIKVRVGYSFTTMAQGGAKTIRFRYYDEYFDTWMAMYDFAFYPTQYNPTFTTTVANGVGAFEVHILENDPMYSWITSGQDLCIRAQMETNTGWIIVDKLYKFNNYSPSPK